MAILDLITQLLHLLKVVVQCEDLGEHGVQAAQDHLHPAHLQQPETDPSPEAPLSWRTLSRPGVGRPPPDLLSTQHTPRNPGHLPPGNRRAHPPPPWWTWGAASLHLLVSCSLRLLCPHIMDGGTRLSSLSGSESGTDPGSRGWVNPKHWAGRAGRLGAEVPSFSSLLHHSPCPPKHNPS